MKSLIASNLISFTFFYILIYSSTTLLKLSMAKETISPNQSISDGETLISIGQKFELGFFSPGSSKNRYVGIWYKENPDTVVWIANRNSPITDSGGILTISSNGTLVLLNGTQSVIWNSNLSRISSSPVAQLLDSGNLVVIDKTNTIPDQYVWQSFDFPCHTRLPGMKIGVDAGQDRYLTSWKSADDPSLGEFTYKIENHGLPQLVISTGSIKKFRTGVWNGIRFSGLSITDNEAFKPVLVFNGDMLISLYEPYNNSVFTTRITLSPSSLLERYIMEENSSKWDLIYTEPYDPCDNYGQCGPNGICRINRTPSCECLKGFTPKFLKEWEVLKSSTGCVRKVPLDCQSGEGFLPIAGVKLPDLLQFWINTSMSLNECEAECSTKCNCTAYANSNIKGGGSGCLIWFGDLIDIREMNDVGSVQYIYIRLPASELDIISSSVNMKKKVMKILVASTVSGMFILGLVCWFIVIKIRAKRRERKRKKGYFELPIFDLATVAAATNNFSHENLIGQGGFGPVYKGNLSTKQEIAVKRLSKGSGQGVEEFKNEVVSIAKLQHRNLVRLLGCCIQGEEKMLIYEYMHNKSLDYYIFDRNRSTLLAWPKRFDIVMGIVRGLLYLHQDSRLRIIHRDLKASNVLLDGELIPKISDFGLARIFEGDQVSARTKRVVGTYGYMSPEYAIDGKFSPKSDVFSMGVLLLEIVNGKRNRGFHHPHHHHNLLGHAWLLWNEDRAFELMDACLKDSYVESQIQRCIQVGLLCVQKLPEDRPTMSTVVFMLANEGVNLPQPKEPGFFIERSSNNSDIGVSGKEFHSNHEEIITILYAR